MRRFGEFEVDGPARELRRGGTPVHLEPQAFDLLLLLLEHRDRVVTKHELLDGVWGHRFASEANLTTRVKEVRRAVGDDGRTQHTIRNARGRGYRFVAAVEEGRTTTTATAGRTLVGREREVEAVLAALGPRALVTVVGPGGAGKSALARAVAEHDVASWPDGTHVVDLGALAAGSPVLPAVARSLQVAFDGEREATAVHSIAQLGALLVLDGCEHVVDRAAALVDDLLSVPGGRIGVVATSQVDLGIGAGAVVELGPLAADDACRLFLARAAAALPSGAEAPEPERVLRLVSRLDRLPLPIEMAAARLRSMSFDEVERAVLDLRGLAQVTHRTPTGRHRSLPSLVGWSTDLLEPRLRQVLVGFAAFAGAVPAADAGAVLRPDDPTSVAFDLAALVERSLLVADRAGAVTRYGMLATVAAVASGWLDGDADGDAIRLRHATHVASALTEVDAASRTSAEGGARARFDLLVDEVRAAHRWARTAHPALADAMSGALVHAAYSTLWHEPATWSEAMLAAAPGDDASPLHGSRLAIAAAAAHRGDLAVARGHAEAVASASDGATRATAIELLADVALYEGDLPLVADLAAELRRLGAQLGDGHAAAVGVADAALASTYGGEPARALEQLEGLEQPASADLAPTDRAWLTYARGEALGGLGRHDEAAAAFEEAAALGESVGNRFVTSVAQVSLAAALARAGDAQRALAAYADALGDVLRHGNHTHAVTALRNLVDLLAQLGDEEGVAALAPAVGGDDRAGRLLDPTVVRSALARVEHHRA